MSDNPYRVAYTPEEVKKFGIDRDTIVAGFRGVSHWPPLTPEQEREFELRGLAGFTGYANRDLIAHADEIGDINPIEELLRFEAKFPEPLIQFAIWRGRQAILHGGCAQTRPLLWSSVGTAISYRSTTGDWSLAG